MDIDLGRGRLYKPGFGANGIYEVAVDGSIPYRLLFSSPDGASSGVFYDAASDRLYYFNGTATAIEVANLDGSGRSVLVQGIPLGQIVRVVHIPIAGPTINCPGDLSVSNDPGLCSAVVSFNVTATGDSPNVVCSPPSGSSFAVGNTLVHCVATDTAGNTASCSFTVTVEDRQAPSIACPSDISLGCSVDMLIPAYFTVTATDDCDPAPIVTSSVPSGAGFPIGTTTVSCTAQDVAGNQSTCSFLVTRVPLGFTGFLQPIGGADATGGSLGAPVRTFKMGSVIPVKFTADCGDSAVTTGVHTLQVLKWTSQTNAMPPIDATPSDAATTGNQFRVGESQWTFNLDTKATGMSIGKWQLVATLSDGSRHDVWIQLK
jgi:hypothetical protein